jgi:mRNA interferase YafQ
MYHVITTKSFERDVALCIKRGYDMAILKEAMRLLVKDGGLPAKYKPHVLKGKWKGCWECHLKSDWLMIWEQNDKELILLFTNTGTHADLFKK